MENKDIETCLPQGCCLIEIPTVSDERGSLTFAEGEGCIPFAVRRVFWIGDVPEGAQRGGHAHWTCAEVVVAVKGAFTMLLDDGNVRSEVRMDRANVGVLVPAGVWCELRDFAPGTLLVVMASEAYDPQGYVHDYEAYKEIKTKN